MKNDNLYQEEVEEESFDSDEEEEEEEDDIIDFDQLEMTMNKSTISEIKSNIHRENENNNNITIDKKQNLDSTANVENDGINKVQNTDNVSNLNTLGDVQQTTKLDDKIIGTNINSLSNVTNAKELKNIDLSLYLFI